MAATQTPVLDTLSPHLKAKFTDMVLARRSSRDIQAMLREHGYKLHWTSVARYINRYVKPALQTASKIASAQGLTESTPDRTRAVADATRQVLAASPVLARVNELWSEWREGTDGSKAEGDWKAHSSYVRAGATLAELEGRASGDPNFAPTQQGATTNILNLAMVLPTETLAGVPTGETLDIEIEPSK